MSVLLQYLFDAYLDAAPDTQASGVTGNTLDDNPDVFSQWVPGYPEAAPDVLSTRVENATSAATAVASGSYFAIVLTPNPGITVNLTSFTFDGGRAGTSTPRGYVLRSSIDGYAANIGTGDFTTIAPEWTHFDLDLTGAQYQGLTAPITFRLYLYCPTSNVAVRLDNITINGTTVMPGYPDLLQRGIVGKSLMKEGKV